MSKFGEELIEALEEVRRDMNGTDALTLMAKGVDPSRMLRLMAMCASDKLWEELTKAAVWYGSHWSRTSGVHHYPGNEDIRWLVENARAHISYADYDLKIKIPAIDYTFSMPMGHRNHDKCAYNIARMFNADQL